MMIAVHGAFLGYLGAVLMGITLGLIGGGGSILTVPILVYLFEIPGTKATFYSLFIVGICAIIGVIPFFKRRLVEVTTGLIFFFPSVFGVLVSRRILLPRVPDQFQVFGFAFTKDLLILTSFAFVMLAASVSMLRKKSSMNSPVSTNDFNQLVLPRFIRTAMNGVVVGLITGFVGAGGGFLIVPALVNGLAMSMERAVGTSLLIIALNSLLAFSSDWLAGTLVEWDFVSRFSVFALLGVFIGTSLNRRIPSTYLKRGFGWFVLIIGAAMLIRPFLKS